MNADVAAASVTEDETPTVKSVETSQSPDITKSPAKPNDQASDTKTSDKTKGWYIITENWSLNLINHIIIQNKIIIKPITCLISCN